MQGILLQSGYFERGLSNKFKEVNFIFLSNCMPSVCHSHVPVCHSYVTRMYSYVIRMSLVCPRMSSLWHSYVVLPWTISFYQLHCYLIFSETYKDHRKETGQLLPLDNYPLPLDNFSLDNCPLKNLGSILNLNFTKMWHKIWRQHQLRL